VSVHRITLYLNRILSAEDVIGRQTGKQT